MHCYSQRHPQRTEYKSEFSTFPHPQPHSAKSRIQATISLAEASKDRFQAGLHDRSSSQVAGCTRRKNTPTGGWGHGIHTEHIVQLLHDILHPTCSWTVRAVAILRALYRVHRLLYHPSNQATRVLESGRDTRPAWFGSR